ncbi:Actin-related protein 4 [Glycine max]|nr:Actin-related protein 4 [Glycine max]
MRIPNSPHAINFPLNVTCVDFQLLLVNFRTRECLLIDPKEHPMLLAEPSSNSQQQRERTVELMFEKYKAPALFLVKNVVLTSFASGRATSLVVDGTIEIGADIFKIPEHSKTVLVGMTF